ncbi:MAG: ABC transporter substrate-binding protein, partial [Bacteroidales bacterium]|nr:ABC transporter substrate-binding protein [Bacteroidales bacterium]
IKQTSEEIQPQERDFLEHRVVKGETLSSIAEKYGISVRDIRRENKGVIFPHVNDILRIPVIRVREIKEEAIAKTDTVSLPGKPVIEIPAGITPVKNLKGKFNVAVLLPFNTPANSVRTEIDSSQVIKGRPVYKTVVRPDEWLYPQTIQFIELYEGILLAADTLRSMGLDINIFAFDTQAGEETPENLIESGKLRNMDLIIGPVYSRNLVGIAQYAARYDIPVVSPVTLISNQPLSGNPNLFLTIPSVDVAQEAIIRRAAEHKKSNFVFIQTDSSGEDEATARFRNRLVKELDSANGDDTLRFRELLFISRSSLPADSINRLEHALSPRHENVIIIASEEHPVLSEIIMSLHSLMRKYRIKLIGLPAVRELVNLDPKLYFDLGIELYSYYWIDYSKPDVRAFVKKFRNKFLTEPVENSYAWMGYDIMYYFLSGISIHGKNFVKHPEMHNPGLLQTKFYFGRKSTDNGFENNHLYLIKYTGSMDIVLIEDPEP